MSARLGRNACWLLTSFLVVVAGALCGCGGTRLYVHGLDATQWHGADRQLPGITLQVGETRRMIKQTRGMTSIGGGYQWGLKSADPTVVEVAVRERGRTVTTSLTGRSAGTTRVYYINRLATPAVTEPNDDRHWFEVTVAGERGHRQQETMRLYTFVFEEELDVEYGRLSFGAEPLRKVGATSGLPFAICDVVARTDDWLVYGVQRPKEGQPQVWQARTSDGLTFDSARCLFELPPPEKKWLAGDLAVVDGNVYLLICDCGDPPTAGHRFHAFSNRDGTWRKLNDEPVYRGQDAFGLVWDGTRFVNYQTTYQEHAKLFPDNMGQGIRRVMHIRTSPDLVHWTPGGSFGVDGPYLPKEQLLVPEANDPEELEFYKCRAFEADGFWSGILVKYIPQPPNLAKTGRMPHGPFLGIEWWVSRDGMRLERPMRATSALESVSPQFVYRLHAPFVMGDELRWSHPQGAFAIDRRRRFYAYCPSNAAFATPPLEFSGATPRLHASFESERLGKQHTLRQGYVMAELIAADGTVVAGYEKEACAYEVSAATEFPLSWGEKTVADVADRNGLRLKLYVRDMRVHSLEY